MARYSPTRVRLEVEARNRLTTAVQDLCATELDQELSFFQADRLVDFFLEHLGAPVYNQAIRDAQNLLQERVGDIDGVLYEPEPD